MKTVSSKQETVFTLYGRHKNAPEALPGRLLFTYPAFQPFCLVHWFSPFSGLFEDEHFSDVKDQDLFFAFCPVICIHDLVHWNSPLGRVNFRSINTAVWNSDLLCFTVYLRLCALGFTILSKETSSPTGDPLQLPQYIGVYHLVTAKSSFSGILCADVTTCVLKACPKGFVFSPLDFTMLLQESISMVEIFSSLRNLSESNILVF